MPCSRRGSRTTETPAWSTAWTTPDSTALLEDDLDPGAGNLAEECLEGVLSTVLAIFVYRYRVTNLVNNHDPLASKLAWLYTGSLKCCRWAPTPGPLPPQTSHLPQTPFSFIRVFARRPTRCLHHLGVNDISQFGHIEVQAVLRIEAVLTRQLQRW